MTNIMQNINVEKITLNMGVGNAPDKLDKVVVLLKDITNANPLKTVTNKRIPTWGVRPGLAIGCKVTLRRKKAEQLLSKLLQAIENNLKKSQFDNHGNVSFGIKEYIDIPEVKYDLNVGMTGLEVAVTLQRPGFRIRKRKIKQAKIPQRHRISQQQAIEFMKQKFKITVEGS